VVPNEWGNDLTNEQLGKDVMLGAQALKTRQQLEELGKNKFYWISLSCGFWYEFSLGGMELRYGFDFKDRKLTLYDDGTTRINTSTWPQCGRAVTKVFSLPIYPEDKNDTSSGPFLSEWHNRAVCIQSFFINQKEMFESVLRVTGDKESDWTITHEDVKKRFKDGQEAFAKGDFAGFGKLLYARMFFPEGDAQFTHEIDNERLGLPKEDLDEYTKVGVGFGRNATSWDSIGK
jgi:hypothetical protein